MHHDWLPLPCGGLYYALRNRYSPANASEALWVEFEHLKRSAYPSIHQAFIDKQGSLDFTVKQKQVAVDSMLYIKDL